MTNLIWGVICMFTPWNFPKQIRMTHTHRIKTVKQSYLFSVLQHKRSRKWNQISPKKHITFIVLQASISSHSVITAHHSLSVKTVERASNLKTSLQFNFMIQIAQLILHLNESYSKKEKIYTCSTLGGHFNWLDYLQGWNPVTQAGQNSNFDPSQGSSSVNIYWKNILVWYLIEIQISLSN